MAAPTEAGEQKEGGETLPGFCDAMMSQFLELSPEKVATTAGR